MLVSNSWRDNGCFAMSFTLQLQWDRIRCELLWDRILQTSNILVFTVIQYRSLQDGNLCHNDKVGMSNIECLDMDKFQSFVPKEFEMIPLSRKSLKRPYTKNNVITAQNGVKSPLVPLKVCLSQKEFEIDNKSMPLQF